MWNSLKWSWSGAGGLWRGRVVAEQHHLDALQPHDAIGLRPAPVIANAHAHVGIHRAPDGEAEIADLEVALLEMLESAPGLVLGMAGQVDLAVLADDLPGPVDQDRRVEAAHLRALVASSSAKPR